MFLAAYITSSGKRTVIVAVGLTVVIYLGKKRIKMEHFIES